MFQSPELYLNYAERIARWWFQTLFMFTPIPGEMIQFDYSNIFQMGWFNHQLDIGLSTVAKKWNPCSRLSFFMGSMPLIGYDLEYRSVTWKLIYQVSITPNRVDFVESQWLE